MSLQIATDAAIKAGFKGRSLITAIAIAGAESNFNPLAMGDLNLQNEKWGASVGLWQIRSLRNYSQYTGADAMRNESRLIDPYYNALAAFAISKGGTDFSPWSTYTNNAYTKFTVTAAAAVKNIIDTVTNNPLTSTALAIAVVLGIIFLAK